MRRLVIVPKPEKELDAIASLRENLRKLEEVQVRLRALLNELQDLVQEDK